jgi:hypothetical protein
MPEYQLLTDDELLHLAEQRDELTDAAQQALDTELRNRHIAITDLQSYRAETAAVKKGEYRRRGHGLTALSALT